MTHLLLLPPSPAGLSVYSSGSEDEGDADSDLWDEGQGRRRSGGSRGSDDSDDDEMLQERIRRKREQFDRKMREMEEEERCE